MKALNFRANFGLYVGLLLLVLFIFLRLGFPAIFANPFVFLIFSLPLILLPGYLINSFLKKGEGIVEKILIWFLLSLGFYLIIGVILFIFKANIFIYAWITIALIAVLLVFVLLKRNQKEGINLGAINLKGENIYFLIPLALIIFFIWILAVSGPEINGDPYFHLSILRKVFEGKAFGPRSLYLTKFEPLNPAYLLPIWHIFLAFLGKVFKLDILVLWQNMALPLFLFASLAWYYLIQKIFANKFLSILGLSLFLVFTFYGTGYLFLRLSVPDTFSQLVLMPLSITFLMGFAFSTKKFHLFFIGLIGFLLILVHLPHYFYTVLFGLLFLIILGIYAVFKRDFRATFGSAFTGLAAFLAPLLIFLLAGLFFIDNIAGYLKSFASQESFLLSYGSFTKFGLLYKYGYFLLPLALVINRKYPKRVIVLLSLLLLTPIIYFTPLKEPVGRLLSFIFVDRLLANTSLYFLVFLAILGQALVWINSKITVLEQKKKDITEIVVASLVFLIIVLEFSTHLVSQLIYKKFYDKGTFSLINDNLWVLWTLFFALAIVGLLIFKKNHEDRVNRETSTLLIAAVIVFMIFSPSFEYLPLKKLFNFEGARKVASEAYFLPALDRDKGALAYLESAPKDSVIFTDPEATKALAVLSKQYTAYVPGLAFEKNLMLLFETSTNESLVNTILLSPKYGLTYILVRNQNVDILSTLSSNPNLKLVYQNEVTIYQVLK